jgi:hypothetical protein
MTQQTDAAPEEMPYVPPVAYIGVRLPQRRPPPIIEVAALVEETFDA